MPEKRNLWRLAVALALTLVLGGAGCGGGGKPGYCSDLDQLEQSIKDIGGIELTSDVREDVTNALMKIESNARATVASAKSDFPDETAAIDKSVSRLQTSARRLADSPSAETAAGAAVDLKALATSVNDFADASKSKCD